MPAAPAPSRQDFDDSGRYSPTFPTAPNNDANQSEPENKYNPDDLKNVAGFTVDQKVFEYMEEHPYRAYLFGSVVFHTRLGKAVHLRIPFTQEKLPFRKPPIVEKIIEQLRLMDLPDMVDSIYERLPIQKKKQEQEQEQEQEQNSETLINNSKELLDVIYEKLVKIHEKINENSNTLYYQITLDALHEELDNNKFDEIHQKIKESLNALRHKSLLGRLTKELDNEALDIISEKIKKNPNTLSDQEIANFLRAEFAEFDDKKIGDIIEKTNKNYNTLHNQTILDELCNNLVNEKYNKIYKKIEKNHKEKEQKEPIENEIARLEKMIRRYADEIGLERKYRLDEIEKRLKRLNADFFAKIRYETKMHLIDENGDESIENTKIKRKARLSQKQKEKHANLQKLQRILEGARKNGETYTTIFDRNYMKLLEPELPILLKIFIEVATLIVALGQGLVAGFFLINTFPMWLALGVCATAGFIVNYFLFKKDFSNLLKEIYINGLSGFFKDENGKFLSRRKTAAISIAGVSCIAAAIAVGFITFNSVQGTIIGMLALASISSPLGAAIAGGIIAILTTMCLGALLFMGINKFIKEDGHLKVFEYLKKDFYNVWKYNEKGWSDLPISQKLKHVGKRSLVAFGNLLLLLLKLTPAIVVFFAIRGLFHTQAVKAMTAVFHLKAHVANQIATVIVDGLGTVANGFLYPRGIIIMLNIIQDCIKKCALFIISPKEHYRDTKAYLSNLKDNNKTLLVATIAIFVVALPILLVFIALNSFGQGFGALVPMVSEYVHKFLPCGAAILTMIDKVCLALSSAGLNVPASYEAIKTPAKLPAKLYAESNKSIIFAKKQPEPDKNETKEKKDQEDTIYTILNSNEQDIRNPDTQKSVKLAA